MKDSNEQESVHVGTGLGEADNKDAGWDLAPKEEVTENVAPPAQVFGRSHLDEADEALAKQQERLTGADCRTDTHDPYPDPCPDEGPCEPFPGDPDVLHRTDKKPDLPKFDNWAHRSQGMRCSSCMWFIEKSGTTVEVFGRCRKRAPTLSGFPAVYGSDWCGDHKMDEMKL